MPMLHRYSPVEQCVRRWIAVAAAGLILFFGVMLLFIIPMFVRVFIAPHIF